MRDLDWSDVEADADRMRTDEESAAYEAWAAEHVEELEEEAYQLWVDGRDRVTDDTSREAYARHIEDLVAEAEFIAENPW